MSGPFRKGGNGWLAQYVMASTDPHYEDLKGEGLMKDMFDDMETNCAGAGEQNLLVLYIQKQGAAIHPAVARAVAGYRKAPLEELFPACAKKVGQERKKPKPAATTIELPTLSDLCKHDDTSTYKSYDVASYFLERQQFHGAKCFQCKESYGKKLKLPNSSSPAHICEGMAKGQCICNGVLCHECYTTTLNASTGRSRRRGKR